MARRRAAAVSTQDLPSVMALLTRAGKELRRSASPSSSGSRPRRVVPWLGYVNACGYGRFGVIGRQIALAHRFAYEQSVGPIPEGHVLHHRCGSPRCVNPDHLIPLTPSAYSRLHAAERPVVVIFGRSRIKRRRALPAAA